MGQCPVTRYVEPIVEKIKNGEFDASDIITHRLSLEQGRHVYEIFKGKEDKCIKIILKLEIIKKDAPSGARVRWIRWEAALCEAACTLLPSEIQQSTPGPSR